MDTVTHATSFFAGAIFPLFFALKFTEWVREALSAATEREKRAGIMYQKALEARFGKR